MGGFVLGNEMTVRQREAWGLAAMSAPTVLLLTGLGWQWVLLGSLAAVSLRALMTALDAKSEGTLTDKTLRAFGKPVGTALLLLSVLWFTMVLARTAAQANTAYPDDHLGQLPGAVLLALAAYGAWTGKQSARNSAGILALILTVLYALLVVAAVRNVDWKWCEPWGEQEDVMEAFAVGLIPSTAFCLPQKRGNAPAALGVAGLAPAILALITAGTLSPALCEREPMPFYTLTKSLRLFSVMERVEPILSGAMLMGMFCIAGLLVSAGSEIISKTCTLPQKWGALGICSLALAASFFTGRISEHVWVIAASIFWGVLPILTQAIAAGKEKQNKSKKTEKRA